MIQALATLLLVAAVSAQDDGLSVEWHDVRSLTVTEGVAVRGIDMRLPITAAQIDQLEAESYDVPLPEDVFMSLDECFDAVERSVEADPAAELESLSTIQGRLRVEGNDAALAITRRTLDTLRALASDKARVEVIRVPDEFAMKVSSPVLDAEETARLFEALTGVAPMTQAVPMGRRVSFGSTRTTSFLADYDVEVAQASMAADAVISIVQSGLHVGVRLDRAADGRRVIARVWGRDAEAETPFRGRSLEGFAGADIELPSASAALFAASGILEPGGALLLRCGSATGSLLVRIRPERADGIPADALVLGEHLVGRMRVRPLWFDPASPSQGWSHDDSNLAEATAPWGSEGIRADEFVEEVLGQRRAANGLISFGSLGLYVGADDDRSSLRTAFDEYAAAAPVHTFGVELAHSLLSPADAAAVLASGDLEAFAKTAAERNLGAVLEGDTLTLTGGIEASYLQDFDVQIAGGSNIQDPIIKQVFDGIGLWISPVAKTDSGGMTAWMDLQRQTLGGELRSAPIVNFAIGVPEGGEAYPRVSGEYRTDLTVELPETRRASSRALVTLEPDTWSLVTAQPVAGGDEVFLMVGRARATR